MRAVSKTLKVAVRSENKQKRSARKVFEELNKYLVKNHCYTRAGAPGSADNSFHRVGGAGDVIATQRTLWRAVELCQFVCRFTVRSFLART